MGIRNKKGTADKPVVKAIDLFCGVGGLTRGMEKAGIDVRLGVDIDPACAYPYEANNEARFLLKSVADLNAGELLATTKGDGLTLLAGCAPCQPFSTYRQKSDPSDERWHLLGHFGRLAKETRPGPHHDGKRSQFGEAIRFSEIRLPTEALEFHVTYEVVNCAEFGVPQQRQRLVLLASKLGPIAAATHQGKTQDRPQCDRRFAADQSR